ncbi:unnamed protein product, partial [marine sediment metagenome]
YERLTEAGSIMGSGGMIVMDEDTCMVDVARYFVDFLRGESCGKCTSCREGLESMYQILTGICEGKGKEGDVEVLEELGTAIMDGSMCALGGTAANPVLSTIRYFRDEYQSHIRDRKCPAGVCRELIRYLVDREKCTGCLLCVKNCPTGSITGERKEPVTLNEDKCIKCGVCFEVCKFKAVVIE